MASEQFNRPVVRGIEASTTSDGPDPGDVVLRWTYKDDTNKVHTGEVIVPIGELGTVCTHLEELKGRVSAQAEQIRLLAAKAGCLEAIDGPGLDPEDPEIKAEVARKYEQMEADRKEREAAQRQHSLKEGPAELASPADAAAVIVDALDQDSRYTVLEELIQGMRDADPALAEVLDRLAELSRMHHRALRTFFQAVSSLDGP